MSILIVEGVTGAGKTSTIDALKNVASFDLFGEEATFDDFMTAFDADANAAGREARNRFSRILDSISSDSRRAYVLERFHFSPLAIGSEWAWYRGINERCVALGCRVVVLTVPDAEIERRSLYRAEYGGADWQALITQYGSEQAARAVIASAQSARLSAIEASDLEHRIIDAGAKAWQRYASEIAFWMGWRRE